MPFGTGTTSAGRSFKVLRGGKTAHAWTSRTGPIAPSQIHSQNSRSPSPLWP